MGLHSICSEKQTQLDNIIHDASANPHLQARAKKLKESIANLESANDITPRGSTQLLGVLHDFQQLEFLYQAKATDESIHATDSVNAKEPNWKNVPVLNAAPELRESLAGRLIHSAFQHEEGGAFPNKFEDSAPLSKDKIMLSISPSTRGTAEHIVSYMLKYDIPFDVDFSDYIFKKTLTDESTKEQVQALAAYNGRKHADIKKHFKMLSKPPAETALPSEKDPGGEKKKILQDGTANFEVKRRSGEIFYALTLIPTPEDAVSDNIPYKDYLKFFFELCDQPWNAIQAAHETLMKRLESTKTLHIIDEDTGTNCSMDIEGKRWANSTVLKNIPGSEVFASPKKESVNGIYVAKGYFQDQNFNTGVMKDISLTFKDGRIIDFDAAEGKDILAQIIQRDDGKGEGSRFAGEIGIGTNPWLRKHVLNPLLVEKISGSAHIAIGSSYSYTHYDGKKVELDNGNRSESKTHWDITTLLQGPKSRIVLDKGTEHEYVLQQAGLFKSPALAVLNQGWAAKELEGKVPPYWQQRLKEVAAERSRA